MIYDLILIGAGAAGLFAGASLPSPVKGLVIEKNTKPGRKLLLSGAGQCNLTHGGSIKDFISHYGSHGRKIRSLLYRFNNETVIDFFESQGIGLFEREDGKVFPKSLQAQDVLNVLVQCCINNGLNFVYSSPVTSISYSENLYSVQCKDAKYLSKKLIITSGGCSYPQTGSDGNLFPVLESMGIELVPMKPALVPIHVQEYPYQELSGISFQRITVKIQKKANTGEKIELTDALLLAHSCFSGPAILNLSRYIRTGDQIMINYLPELNPSDLEKKLIKQLQGSSKQLITVLTELLSRYDLPKRFLETVCGRCGIDPAQKGSQITAENRKKLLQVFTNDTFSVSGLGGYAAAMVTSGGVALSEVNLKTMESVRYPSLYFAGEVLDIDGDTGGYNLQFAFASGNLAAQQILK